VKRVGYRSTIDLENKKEGDGKQRTVFGKKNGGEREKNKRRVRKYSNYISVPRFHQNRRVRRPRPKSDMRHNSYARTCIKEKEERKSQDAD